MSKRKLTIVLACLVVIGGCILLFLLMNQPSSASTTSSASASTSAEALALTPPRSTVNVGGVNFEISSTSAEQQQGLSDRADVPDNYAMLFVFPQDGQYGFWMKDMEVPLDMVWVTSDNTIASVTPDIGADTYPTVYYPPEPIRYVLETRAGFAAEKGWKAGMQIQLPSPY